MTISVVRIRLSAAAIPSVFSVSSVVQNAIFALPPQQNHGQENGSQVIWPQMNADVRRYSLEKWSGTNRLNVRQSLADASG